MEKCGGDLGGREGVKIFGIYKQIMRMRITCAVFFVTKIIISLDM
jgi:hypothetical protein